MHTVASNSIEQLFLIEPEAAPSDPVVDQAISSSDPQQSPEKKPRKARSKDATTVPIAVKRLFAMSTLFPQFGDVAELRVPAKSTPSALGKVYSAPELPDDDDRLVAVLEDLDDMPQTGPSCQLDDTQLVAEQRAWLPSERQVFLMHVLCLEENLAFLRATDMKPRVWHEKGEILQWIWSVDEIDGKNVKDIPFSFVNCCDAARIDPDALRRMLLQLPVVRSLLVNLCLAREEDLPPLQVRRYYADYVGPEVATPEHPVHQFPGVS